MDVLDPPLCRFAAILRRKRAPIPDVGLGEHRLLPQLPEEYVVIVQRLENRAFACLDTSAALEHSGSDTISVLAGADELVEAPDEKIDLRLGKRRAPPP